MAADCAPTFRDVTLGSTGPNVPAVALTEEDGVWERLTSDFEYLDTVEYESEELEAKFLAWEVEDVMNVDNVDELDPWQLEQRNLQLSYGQPLQDCVIPDIFLYHIGPYDGVEVGWGVFARSKIVAGSYVGEYTGVVSSGSAARSKDAYKMSYPSPLYTPRCFLKADTKGSFTRFINHSSTAANVDWKDMFWDGRYHVIMIATADIEPGTQLLVNYGPGFFKKRKEVRLDLFELGVEAAVAAGVDRCVSGSCGGESEDVSGEGLGSDASRRASSETDEAWSVFELGRDFVTTFPGLTDAIAETVRDCVRDMGEFPADSGVVLAVDTSCPKFVNGDLAAATDAKVQDAVTGSIDSLIAGVVPEWMDVELPVRVHTVKALAPLALLVEAMGKAGGEDGGVESASCGGSSGENDNSDACNNTNDDTNNNANNSNDSNINSNTTNMIREMLRPLCVPPQMAAKLSELVDCSSRRAECLLNSLLWTVLLHDVAKVVTYKDDGTVIRDPAHPFRSAADAAPILARLLDNWAASGGGGNVVGGASHSDSTTTPGVSIDNNGLTGSEGSGTRGAGGNASEDAMREWSARARSAVTTTDDGTVVHDNSALPDLVAEATAIFSPPVAVILHAILLHQSWPAVAMFHTATPLDFEQSAAVFSESTLQLLEPFQLVDSFSYNMYEPGVSQLFTFQFLAVVAEIRARSRA